MVNKIFIFNASNAKPGGCEGLYQLEDKLLKLGHDAYMVFIPSSENPVPDIFKKYNVKIAQEVEDDKDNVLITPECWISKLTPYKNIQKAIYWLSVEHAERTISTTALSTNSKYPKLKKIPGLRKTYTTLYKFFKTINFKDENLLHLAPCAYPIDYLQKEGLYNIYPVADYAYTLQNLRTNPLFERKSGKYRENNILYNPKKNGRFLKKIINKSPQFNWIKIEKLTPDGVLELMTKSKVYIDFGYHPGKERMPREAIVCGCCVIVGKKGTAKYFQDVPILNKYKFDFERKEIKKIIATIQDCLDNYDERIKEFETYRRITEMQEENMEFNIRQLFGDKR